MNARRDLHRLIDDLLGDDPREALIAYRRLTNDEVPWLEYRVVNLARKQKWNWAKIGRLLGRSRQGLNSKFGKPKLVMRSDPYADYHRQQAEFARLTRREPADDEEVIAW
jgi:hypothetical protein